ncbi:MAG: VWA domain-containing protein [Neomegalonema sp.]|nr:VWA domain-containing protein [Neomegalonema sp.]
MSEQDRQAERERRWHLALGPSEGEGGGGLSSADQRLDAALTAVYGSGEQGGKRKAGLGGSAPRLSRWLGDIREFFPGPSVQVIQRDAIERLGLKQLLTEPELLESLEPDVHLVADLIALGAAIPERTRETARLVVRKVVEDLMARLEGKTGAALRGALNRAQRSRRPRPADIDWPRTIAANLHTWQPEHHSIIPDRLIGGTRTRSQRLAEVVLLVDQSGSMAPSVVYSAIFAAVMASLPALRTQMIAFDTAVVDLTEMLRDPVEVLFGVQLGGGTDIAKALAYAQGQVRSPQETVLVLISDLYEGGTPGEMLARLAQLVASGVKVVVLLALSDDGAPGYDTRHAEQIAALGAPVFACTPDLFPQMMAAALKGEDLTAWAAREGIKTARGDQAPS